MLLKRMGRNLLDVSSVLTLLKERNPREVAALVVVLAEAAGDKMFLLSPLVIEEVTAAIEVREWTEVSDVVEIVTPLEQRE